jgi:large subunit ribosomal protein L25
MEMLKLQVNGRRAHGSREASRLRRQGKLPGVVYGHGEEPTAVALGVEELERALEEHSPILELDIDGQSTTVLLKEIQYDHLGLAPIHVDFMRVDVNERVTVSVPLEYKGTAAGTLEGGIFEGILVDIEVECLAGAIPESIRVNVGELLIGQSLYVRNIVLPEGITAMSSGDAIACTVRAKLAEEAVVAVPGEEGPQQPEIITARKPAEGEEEGEKPEKKEKK